METLFHLNYAKPLRASFPTAASSFGRSRAHSPEHTLLHTTFLLCFLGVVNEDQITLASRQIELPFPGDKGIND